MKALVLFCLAIPFFASCVSIQQKRCNYAFAYDSGVSDARNGKTDQPSRYLGSVCESAEYLNANFLKDYDAGFESVRAQTCQIGVARQLGIESAQKFNRGSDYLFYRLNICTGENSKELGESFAAGNSEVACKTQYLTLRAQNVAQTLNAGSYKYWSTYVQDYCTADIADSFQQQFKRYIRETCAPGKLYERGVSDARSGSYKDAPVAELELCPQDLLQAGISALTSGFNQTRSAIRQEESLRRQEESLRRREQALRQIQEGNERRQLESARGENDREVIRLFQRYAYKSGNSWYYKNGSIANLGGANWYYQNGSSANLGGTTWYYPNGRSANFGNSWYFPNGRSVRWGDSFYDCDGNPMGLWNPPLQNKMAMVLWLSSIPECR